MTGKREVPGLANVVAKSKRRTWKLSVRVASMAIAVATGVAAGVVATVVLEAEAATTVGTVMLVDEAVSEADVTLPRLPECLHQPR